MAIETYNLRRWVYSSVGKYFKENGYNNILLGTFTQNYAEIEGLGVNEKLRLEFRLDGPLTKRRGPTQERHTFMINFLLTCEVNNDVFHMDEELDRLRRTLKDTYCIYEIEDGKTAPFTLVGGLKMDKGNKNPQVHNFGIIRADLKLAQGVITAQHYIDLPVER